MMVVRSDGNDTNIKHLSSVVVIYGLWLARCAVILISQNFSPAEQMISGIHINQHHSLKAISGKRR